MIDRGLSARIVWPIAAEEAMAGKFECIEPSHVFNAILKFAEIERHRLAAVAKDSHSKALFKKEQKSTRSALKAHRIDVPEMSMKIRRAIRARLGSGGFKLRPGWHIHRSDVTRRIADTAEEIAAAGNSRVVTAMHLLEALFDKPDEAMEAVLREQGVYFRLTDEDDSLDDDYRLEHS